MADTRSAPARQRPQAASAAAPAPLESGPELVEEELLVEEISIDGMCGVY
jgi:mycofactocin precursor